VFTTLFIGILNTTTGALNFCNAGHNYPYLLKGGELFEVKTTHGPAPGAIGGAVYKSGKMKLDHGDKLILYTDGVTYADNGTGGYFGKDRLETLLTNERGSDVSTITKQLMKALRKHSGKTRQVDDLTVLAIEFEGKKGEV
jgi:phosphoserine phosphatase RsbU/P